MQTSAGTFSFDLHQAIILFRALGASRCAGFQITRGNRPCEV
jgi:hypothetical protein